MHPRRSLLAVAAGALVAPLWSPAPAAHADNPSTFPDVVAPVLATDAKGNNLLVLQRDVNGTSARGQVVAHFRARGANAWTGRVNVSRHTRTGRVADVAMGPGGVGVVAWTARATDGRRAVFVRIRLASGAWTAQQRVSPFGVGQDVDVAMNRYRDIAVAYVYRDHARLATRVRGGGWQQAATTDSTFVAPEADFRGRHALLTYRAGRGEVDGQPSTLVGTGVGQVSRELPSGALVRRTLVSTPVGNFALGATSTRPPHLVITTNRMDANEENNSDCGDAYPDGGRVRLYQGTVGSSSPWVQQWEETTVMWRTKPAVDVAADRLGPGGSVRAVAKVSWLRGFGGWPPCSDGLASVVARTWDRESGWTARFVVGTSIFSPDTTLAQALGADGASWVSSTWDHWQSAWRPGPRPDLSIESEDASREEVGPPAVTVGPIGLSVVAWMAGEGTEVPLVRVQRFSR